MPSNHCIKLGLLGGSDGYRNQSIKIFFYFIFSKKENMTLEDFINKLSWKLVENKFLSS